MSDNPWIQILDTMYNEMMVSEINSEKSAVGFDLPRHSTSDSITELSKLLDYNQETLEEELSALAAAGLAEEISENTYGLTETGIRVAHERQQNRQQQKTQKILSYLTVVLAVSATGQFIIGIAQTGLTNSTAFLLLVGYVVTLLGMMYLIRSNVEV